MTFLLKKTGTQCVTSVFQNLKSFFQQYNSICTCVEQFWCRSGTFATQRPSSRQSPGVHIGGPKRTLEIYAWPEPGPTAMHEDKCRKFLENAQKWHKYGFYNFQFCDTIFHTPPPPSCPKSAYLAAPPLKLFFYFCSRWFSNIDL